MGIQRQPLPPATLLDRYARQRADTSVQAYVDCYAVEVDGAVSLSEYVLSFYTSGLFRMERWLLARILKTTDSNEQAQQLARARTTRFSAWTVEDRSDEQLLMCDLHGRTRSWFMVQPSAESPNRTCLYFGSAVVPDTDSNGQSRPLGWWFKVLLPVHRLYSRALLNSAVRRLPPQSGE